MNSEKLVNLLGLLLNKFFSYEKPVKMDTEINPNSVVKLNVRTMFMTTQGTLLSDLNSQCWQKCFPLKQMEEDLQAWDCNILTGLVNWFVY